MPGGHGQDTVEAYSERAVALNVFLGMSYGIAMSLVDTRLYVASQWSLYLLLLLRLLVSAHVNASPYDVTLGEKESEQPSISTSRIILYSSDHTRCLLPRLDLSHTCNHSHA